MKTSLCLLTLLATVVRGASATEPVGELFREGLFEEEANRNLPAAIQAYEEVVQRLDEQRQLAATAVFRLGECYRKLGRTQDALAAYERVLREFPAEDTLAKLSRENISLLRPSPVPPLATDIAPDEQTFNPVQLLDATIADLERRLAVMQAQSEAENPLPAMLSLSDDPLLHTIDTEQTKLETERAGLLVSYGPEHPLIKAVDGQLAVLKVAGDERVQAVITGSQLLLGAFADARLKLLSQIGAANVSRTQADLALKGATLDAQLMAIDGTQSPVERVALAQTAFSDRRLDQLVADHLQADLEVGSLRIKLGDSHPQVRAALERRNYRGIGVRNRVDSLITAKRALLGELQASGANMSASVQRSPTASADQQRTLLLEEIALVEQALVAEERRVSAGAGPRSDLLPLQRDLLSLKRELARLDSVITADLYSAQALPDVADPTIANAEIESTRELIQLIDARIELLEARSTDRVGGTVDSLPLRRERLKLQRDLPENAAVDLQTELFNEEIALVEEALENQRVLVEAGRATPDDVLKLERDRLTLQRQLSAAQSAPAATESTASRPAPVTNEEADEIRRIQALVANSPDLVNAPTRESTMTELMTAAHHGRLVVVRYLLDHGARVDAARSDGETALHYAVSGGHLKIAELLLERGAAVDANASRGRTPLHDAARRGYLELARLLLSAGASIDALMTSISRPPTGIYGGTPLWTAIANRQTAMAEYLLGQGADPNLGNDEAGVPLTAADTPELVRLLLDKGADPNADGGAPVLKAAEEGDLETLRLLLEKGADPNLSMGDDRQLTPLHLAVMSQHLEMVETLVTAGVDVNRKDGNGQTPLAIALVGLSDRSGVRPGRARVPTPVLNRPPITAMATRYGLPADVRSSPASSNEKAWGIIRTLIAHGADVNEDIIDGSKPIHYAAAFGDVDLLEWFAEKGADLNDQGQRQVTPLMIAVCREQAEMVDGLLSHGAAVDLQNEDGNTALHFAAYERSRPMVERLIQAGASRDVENVTGHSPLALVDATFAMGSDSFGVPMHQYTDAARRVLVRGMQGPSPDAPELRRLLSTPESATEPEPEAAPE